LNLLPYYIVKRYNTAVFPLGILPSPNPILLREFENAFKEKSRLLENNRFCVYWEEIFPCLTDKTDTTPFEPHYTYHPAWAARVLAKTKPKEHVDIGSSLNFVSYASAFIPIRFYDYRPVELNLSNLTSDFADITKLPFDDNSIESLSCMYVVEHIGMERYGDPFDPEGDLKAIRELERVLKPDGNLLFVVPIGGKMRIQYNAHRIYTYKSIMEYFKNLKLASFSLITDNSEFIENAANEISDMQKWGCGCFWFKKDKRG
jgi:hypothetical protein